MAVLAAAEHSDDDAAVSRLNVCPANDTLLPVFEAWPDTDLGCVDAGRFVVVPSVMDALKPSGLDAFRPAIVTGSSLAVLMVTL